MNALFLGGPWADKWRAIESREPALLAAKYVHKFFSVRDPIAESQPLQLSSYTYLRVTPWLYRVDTMTNEQMLYQLVEHYRP